MRRSALFLMVPLVAGLAGCGSDEPPAAGAKLCAVTDASWWYDATGAGDLKGVIDGPRLPLKNSVAGRSMFQRSDCRVFSDDKVVGRYQVGTKLTNRIENLTAQIARSSPDDRFSVAGGVGMVVREESESDGTVALWTCGSAVLEVSLLRPKDEKRRVELAKTLAQRVAPLVGCPPRIP